MSSDHPTAYAVGQRIGRYITTIIDNFDTGRFVADMIILFLLVIFPHHFLSREDFIVFALVWLLILNTPIVWNPR